MVPKIPTDDTSKPGFVSAIVMKFTNMQKNSMELSPKEKHLQSQYRNKRENASNSEVPTTPVTPKDVEFCKDKMSSVSTGSTKSLLDNRINAEYQVIGDVSVKDRIKAFTALQKTVNNAAQRPEVLKSSRYTLPKKLNQFESIKSGPVTSSSSTTAHEKLGKSSKSSTSIDDHNLVGTPKVSELISKLNKAVSVDKSQPKPVYIPTVKKQQTPSIPLQDNQPLTPKEQTSIDTQPSNLISKSDTDSDSSVSSVDLDKNNEYSFKYNISAADDDDCHESAVYNLDTSILDDVLQSDNDDVDVDNDNDPFKLASHSDHNFNVSGQCIPSSCATENANYRIFDPSDDPNYFPLPKSYRVNVDNNGCFHIVLPTSKYPSILKKSSTEKKDLSIKFDTEVINMMETYSVFEYERGDDTIDPLTASAEYEIEKKTEALDKFQVRITKDERGLGMSIVGIGLGSDIGAEKLGIYIKALTPGGASEKSNLLRVHDQLLEVDGISLVGVTQSFAAQTLKSTSKIVEFLIGREKATPSIS